MGEKGVRILGVLVLLFAALFFFSELSDRRLAAPARELLLADVPVEQVRSVLLEQGPAQVELTLVDGNWTLPAKHGYRADVGKVRALLLELLEMSVSQHVTENPAKHELLGVSESAVKSGQARVQLRDQEQKVLAEVFFGKLRRSKNQDAYPTPAGQYLRRGGDDEVFILAKPLTLTLDLANWLDASIGSVLESQVVRVEQRRAGAGAPLFVLERKDTKGDLALISGRLEQSAQQLAAAALENMRLADVLPAEDPTAAALKFDVASTYQLQNGLSYSVESARVGSGASEQNFLRLKVALGETPAVAAPTTEGAEVKPATAEDAKALNDRLAAWVFKVPDFLAAKFRQGL